MAKPNNNFAGKKALITGGLGFIGSNIAHRMVAAGAEVRVFDACLDPYGWNFANISEIRDKIEFMKGDTRDEKAVREAVDGADLIFDCASQISHSISVEKPLVDIQINCIGALNLLEAARNSKSDPTIVYAGTRGQIGQMKYCPIDEAHPTDPVDMNGINKLAAEKYCMLYNRLYGLKTTSLRINNAYGERCQVRHADYGIVNYFIRLAIEGKDLTVYGDGLQKRDYSHVSDIVEAMVLSAASKRAIGEYFMLGSNAGVGFIDICKLILSKAGGGGKLKMVPWDKSRKAIEIWDFIVSNKKISEYLGWKPRIGLEEGIERTIAFYRERRNEYF